jgi:hypothetical protein
MRLLWTGWGLVLTGAYQWVRINGYLLHELSDRDAALRLLAVLSFPLPPLPLARLQRLLLGLLLVPWHPGRQHSAQQQVGQLLHVAHSHLGWIGEGGSARQGRRGGGG